MEYKEDYLQLAKNATSLEELAKALQTTEQQIITWATQFEGEKMVRPQFFEIVRELRYPEPKPKHAGGRPVLYETVEELQSIIDEYFEYCNNKTKEIHSEKLGDMIVPDPEPYTMSGLALKLGLSRQGLIEYSHKDQFSDAIKRARHMVEADVERRMNDKSTFTPGLIFNAKNNFGWKDKQEIDHKNNGGDFPTPIYGGTAAKTV